MGAVIAIGMISCNPPTNQKGSSETPKAPQITPKQPPVTPPPQNSITLTESDVLAAFSLTKGHITASAAAKKIVTNAPASGITFTERKMIAYDDEVGTFTVKVKGSKDGKNFSQKISVTGFTHPLAEKFVQSVASCELNLDDAIEHNYSLTKYIEEVNKDPSGKKLVKKLSFMLNDGTTIELGEHDSYTLTAKAKKGMPDTKIVVQPSIMLRKLTEGGTEELIENTAFSFYPLKEQLKQNYFEAKDVFKYILDKTADSAIKADSTEFASSFYAFVKESGQTPANLFTKEFTDAVKKYADLYQTKDMNEHLVIDKITYGIAQPKNGGIDADDYAGTVKIHLCIATEQQIADKSGITAIKPIEKSGFAKIIDANELNKQVFFAVVSNLNPSATDIQDWKDKTFTNYRLLSVDNSNGTVAPNPIINPLPGSSGKPFQLCVNGTDNLASQLGCRYFGASLTKNGKSIFIENIVLDKKQNETDIKITVQLKGFTDFLTIVTNPGPAYR